jgi:hypothetical protein
MADAPPKDILDDLFRAASGPSWRPRRPPDLPVIMQAGRVLEAVRRAAPALGSPVLSVAAAHVLAFWTGSAEWVSLEVSARVSPRWRRGRWPLPQTNPPGEGFFYSTARAPVPRQVRTWLRYMTLRPGTPAESPDA